MSDFKISILLPTYNRSDILLLTINSILKQKFENFEILVSDDCSSDDTEYKVRKIGDDRIIYHKNARNLGIGRNLQACYGKSKGDIVFLMGDDDFLMKDALLKTHNAFLRGENVGLVTRPYYWFWNDPQKPIRAILPYDSTRDSEMSIFDGRKEIEALFKSVGQLSGLAFRRQYMDVPFNPDVFTTHIYPFASILKKYKAVYLKDFTVAVRTSLSMSTHKRDIYDTSPIESWIKMFNILYSSKGLDKVRTECIDFVVRDTYSGLFQIKTTTGSISQVTKEIKMILKNRPQSIRDSGFYLDGIVAIVVPGKTPAEVD